MTVGNLVPMNKVTSGLEVRCWMLDVRCLKLSDHREVSPDERSDIGIRCWMLDVRS